MSTYKSQLNELRKRLAAKDIKLDLRSQVYILNDYGLYPCFDYGDAYSIISEMIEMINEKNDNVIFNTSMTVEKLRSERLSGIIQEYFNYYLDQ
nr:hypothetical protein [Moritella viscosa]SHO15142.1 unnamed protein product [Moritella viscosa]